MIPEGYYNAKVVPVDDDGTRYWYQLATTPGGKEKAMVVFELLDGPAAGETIAWDGWLSTNDAETRTMASLQLMGWDPSKANIIEGQCVPLLKIVNLNIKHEEYKGEVRAKVAWVNDPAGRFRVKPENRITGAAAQRLANRLAKAKPANGPAAPKEREPGEDDALPDWT